MVNPALLLHYVFKKVRLEPEVANFMIKPLISSALYILIDWQKLSLEGPGPLVVNIIVVRKKCSKKLKLRKQ